MEVWKDIIGYEGLYQVSDQGNVKSLERRVRNHKSGSTRHMKEHLIHPTDNGHGYMIVGLRKNGRRKNFYIHRLVADHFLTKPIGKEYINHIDFNKTNNSVENLEWCTQKENINHSSSNMRKPKEECKVSNTGEKYISRGIEHKKNVRYRVNIRQVGICKSFANLDEAIKYRNEVMNEWQNQYFKKIETVVSCAE